MEYEFKCPKCGQHITAETDAVSVTPPEKSRTCLKMVEVMWGNPTVRCTVFLMGALFVASWLFPPSLVVDSVNGAYHGVAFAFSSDINARIDLGRLFLEDVLIVIGAVLVAWIIKSYGWKVVTKWGLALVLVVVSAWWGVKWRQDIYAERQEAIKQQVEEEQEAQRAKEAQEEEEAWRQKVREQQKKADEVSKQKMREQQKETDEAWRETEKTEKLNAWIRSLQRQ